MSEAPWEGKPTDCIPEGMYCYTRLTEPDKNGRSKVKYCPYLESFFDPTVNNQVDDPDSHWVPFCAFMEIDGKESILLWDSCKECGENERYDLDELDSE